MSQPSSNYLHRVEQWIRGGADLQRINFSTVQRFRARIVYEAYWEWLQDHFIDPSDTLRRLAKREYAMLLHKAKEGNSEAQEYVDALNIREGVPRTPSEISSDVYTLNYIVNTLTVSTRAMDRIKVTASADWLMSHGMKTGNDRRSLSPCPARCGSAPGKRCPPRQARPDAQNTRIQYISSLPDSRPFV